MSKPKWLPIKTVPKDGTYFLTWRDGKIDVARYYKMGPYRIGDGRSGWHFLNDELPTHWMPLPPPPETKP